MKVEKHRTIVEFNEQFYKYKRKNEFNIERNKMLYINSTRDGNYTEN